MSSTNEKKVSIMNTKTIPKRTGMQNAKRRVVIYVRISKDRIDQTSTETQEAEAIQYANSRGWEVVTVCSDQGKSAYKRNVKRPAFDRAMRMIETKQAEVFLVWKLDRFYRGLDEFNGAWARIRNGGGELASVTEPAYDTTSDDPMVKWAIMGFAAMAEIESRNRSHRSKSNHHKRFADGAIPNGPRPFGYDKKGKGELVLNKAEAAFIRNAAQRVLNGESLRSILRTTNMVGSTGKPLTPRGLSFALTCPRNAGFRRHTETGNLMPGNWTPVLDRETWEALLAKFDDPSRRTGPSNQISHILSGIMTCGKCTGPMGSRTWKGDGYRYQCRTCGQSMDEAKANEVVKAKVLELCPPDRWDSLRTQGRGFDPAVIENIEKKLAAVDKQFENDKIDIDRWMNLNAKFNDQLAAAKSTEVPDLPAIENLADEWDSLALDDVRKVIAFVTESVTLHTVKGGSTNPFMRIEVA